jgi:hypothetical protein
MIEIIRHAMCYLTPCIGVEEDIAMTFTTADAMTHRPADRGADDNADFSFLPKALVDKCRPFIVRYHELNGFGCLPDILWHPESRNFIDSNAALERLFRKSTCSRSAKKANDGFVAIATVILATEILASGFAGWAARYPAARKRAQALLAEYVPSSRALLIERYLYPQIDRSRTILGALAPPDPHIDPSRKVAPLRAEAAP